MIQRMEGVNWKIYAHRAAWILCNGPIADGLQVLHRCPGGDVPYCVRPSHMVLDTQDANMKQMTADGHNHFSKVKFCGERNKNSKITWEIVREIRRLWLTKAFTLKSLGEKFGIHLGTVWGIVHNKQWKE